MAQQYTPPKFNLLAISVFLLYRLRPTTIRIVTLDVIRCRPTLAHDDVPAPTMEHAHGWGNILQTPTHEYGAPCAPSHHQARLAHSRKETLLTAISFIHTICICSRMRILTRVGSDDGVVPVVAVAVTCVYKRWPLINSRHIFVFFFVTISCLSPCFLVDFGPVLVTFCSSHTDGVVVDSIRMHWAAKPLITFNGYGQTVADFVYAFRLAQTPVSHFGGAREAFDSAWYLIGWLFTRNHCSCI